jgi:hypothetical protein
MRLLFLILTVVALVCAALSPANGIQPAEEAPYAGSAEQGDGSPADTSSQPTSDGQGDSDLPPGLWNKIRGDSRTRLTQMQLDKIKQLESIGYLSGSRPKPKTSGVITYDSARAFEGYNFYVSGHAPEAILMDMEGRVLHTWSHDFSSIWPDLRDAKDDNKDFWRRAYLYKNGDILAIHEGIGLIKLDKHSKLLWKYGGKAHHDMDVMEDGRIYVLTRQGRVIPRINEEEPVVEDFITTLDADGNEIDKVSILECLERCDDKSLFNRMLRKGDILHTNTIEILDGRLADRSPAFRAGNALISILKLDAIAVVDLDKKKIVWSLTGKWRRQHQPTILPGGTMLLFDNRGYKSRSRVIELDPITTKWIWQYRWNPDNPFYSKSSGSCQRLENGDTLITESDGGRAFEVTPDKSIVWEYVSPHRAGPDGEFIATLFELVRLEPDFPLDWIP